MHQSPKRKYVGKRPLKSKIYNESFAALPIIIGKETDAPVEDIESYFRPRPILAEDHVIGNRELVYIPPTLESPKLAEEMDFFSPKVNFPSETTINSDDSLGSYSLDPNIAEIIISNNSCNGSVNNNSNNYGNWKKSEMDFVPEDMGYTEEEDKFPIHKSLDGCPSKMDNYAEEFITKRQIGVGEFIIAYLVLCKSDNQYYVIKRSKDTSKKSGARTAKKFLKEIELFELVQENRNIVRYYKVWQEENVSYQLQELCSRGTLRSYLTHVPNIPESVIWRVLYILLNVLCTLHGKGLIHQDIKPENILVTENGEIRLGDFGLATFIGSPSEQGDQRYMRHCEWNEPASAISDIFSLGLTAYELMSHISLPVNGDQWIKLRTQSPPRMDQYSLRLNTFILDMISADCNETASSLLLRIPKRYQSTSAISQFNQSLLSILALIRAPNQIELVGSGEQNSIEMDRSLMITPVDSIKETVRSYFFCQ